LTCCITSEIGSVAIVHVKDSLGSIRGVSVIKPAFYMTVHQSAIRTICWIRIPPGSSDGSPSPLGDPCLILSCGYDGQVIVTDIREIQSYTITRSREAITAACFSPMAGAPITLDFDNTVKLYAISPHVLGQGHALIDMEGPIWSLAASDYHAQLAIGSADGSCCTTNVVKSAKRGGSVPFLMHKIYQLDYSRKLKEFRMVENFLPKETFDKPTAARKKAQKAAETGRPGEKSGATGAWPKEVSVTRVTWDSGGGMSSAPLLASATASGLCRIDWLLGRFFNNRVPLGSVEALRGEVAVAGDIEDEDSDEA